MLYILHGWWELSTLFVELGLVGSGCSEAARKFSFCPTFIPSQNFSCYRINAIFFVYDYAWTKRPTLYFA